MTSMWTSVRIFVLCLFAGISSHGYAGVEDPVASPPPAGQYPSGLLKIGPSRYFSSHAFVVDKALRTLTVWKEDEDGLKIVAVHATDLGKRDGAKQLRGDHRTPEGVYFLQELKQEPEIPFTEYGKRAYTTNYPNFFDRIAGKTGDGIWLHAVPDQTSLQRGSRGCVVVRNDVIVSLGQYFLPTKTPLLIFDKVQYLPLSQRQTTLDGVKGWLQQWVSSWEGKDITKYIENYSPSFQSQAMNRDGWKSYKEGLAKSYQTIRVEVEEPSIFLHEKEVVIRFLQHYQSDKHTDFGEKTLYVQKSPKGYEIVGEEWKPLDQKQMAMILNDKKDSAQSN